MQDDFDETQTAERESTTVAGGRDATAFIADNIAGDFIINSRAAFPEPSVKEENSKAPDPTVRFHPDPEVEFSLDSDTKNGCVETILRRKVLFMTCPDPDVRRSATLELTQNLGDIKVDAEADKTLKPRLLSFRHQRDPEACLLRSVFESERTWTSPTLLVVEAQGEEAQPFLDDIFASWTDSQNRLKDNETYLLVSTTRLKLTRARRQERVSSLSDFHVAIEFLEPRLQKVFPKDSKKYALELEERWKARRDDPGGEVFWGHLVRLLETPSLIEQIAQHRQSIGEAFEKVLAEEKEQALEILKQAGTFEKAVLFLGAFLPDLSPEEFLELLGGLRPERNEDTSFLQMYSTTKYSITQWGQRYVEILAACQMRITARTSKRDGSLFGAFDEGERVVSFDHPNLGRQVAQAFLTDYYFDFLGFAEGLLEINWPINPNKRVRLGLIDLLITRARIDPSLYGNEILKRLVSVENHLFNNEAQSSSAHKSGTTGVRIDMILRRMVRFPNLAPVVDSFLNDLMYRKEYDAVLELIRQLGATEGFSLAFWWRQLLERAPSPDQDKISKRIHDELHNPQRQQVTLSILTEWLDQGGPGQNSWRVAFEKLVLIKNRLPATVLFVDPETSPSKDRVRTIITALFLPETWPGLPDSNQHKSLQDWIKHWFSPSRGDKAGQFEEWESNCRQVAANWVEGVAQRLASPSTDSASPERRVANLFRSIVLASWAYDLLTGPSTPEKELGIGKLEVDSISGRLGNKIWEMMLNHLNHLSEQERDSLADINASWQYLQVATSDACNVALRCGLDGRARVLYKRTEILGTIQNDLSLRKGIQ